MNKVYTERKSPFLAGTLSIIPGLGQIYNEQAAKGIFLFVLFVGTFFIFVLRLSPMYFFHQFGLALNPGLHNGMFKMHIFPSSPFFPMGISRFYPLLWFLVIFPFFIVFSISDAVQNARNINLGFNPRVQPQPVTPPPPPERTPETHAQQEELRMEAQQKLNQSAAASATFRPSMEETMNTQNTQQNAAPNPQENPRCTRGSRGVSGKFFLGIVLMIVGGTFILEDYFHIPVWSFHTWDRLWPLIPLLFGLRILREYQRDRDRGQFVMGFLFTAVGGIFLLDRWTNFEVVHFIENSWMFVLFGVGVLFVLLDLSERIHRER